jgi:hypothetical protein
MCLVCDFNNFPCITRKKKTNCKNVCRDPCLKDIYNISDAIDVLSVLTTNGYVTAETITERLSFLYRINPPGHDELSRLSLIHNSFINTGGMEEYAISTIWMVANESILRNGS